MDGGTKREVLVGGGLEHSINVRAISSGHFATMGVADEFANDALKDAFLVGHQRGFERRQVAHLAAVR